MRCSNRSRGNAPAPSSWSWNARMSNSSPSSRLSTFAQREHFQLPDFVGERLAGPAYVAIDLVDDVVFCLSLHCL